MLGNNEGIGSLVQKKLSDVFLPTPQGAEEQRCAVVVRRIRTNLGVCERIADFLVSGRIILIKGFPIV